jgi:tetratricopeptide (TPR) repeat protein
LAGLLALLVGGAFLYDAVVNRLPAPYVAPETAAPAVPAVPVAAASEPPPPLPSRGRGDETAVTPPRAKTPDAGTTPDALTPRSRRSGAERAPPDSVGAGAGAGAGDVRISISREPAPLDAAWAAQQAGDLDRAESLYRRVLESEQGQVDAQLGLAVIAHARGNDAAARRGYRQVLESAPEHPRAWAGLAELAGEDDAGGIESRLRQLLANRQSGPLHFALGNVLARQERWSDAQQEYFAAATLAPDAPDYAYNVAVALERIGKPAAAMPWYSRALQQAASGRAVRFDATAARARLDQLQAAPP